MSNFLFILAITSVFVITITLWRLIKLLNTKKNPAFKKKEEEFEIRGI